MTALIEWLRSNPFVGLDLATKLFGSLVVILVILVARHWILLLLLRKVTDIKQIYNLKRNSSYLASVLIFTVIGIAWLESAREVVTYLGLLSAGVAIALKDPLTNIVGWATILWRRPFKVGDRIQIGKFAGDVIDINILQFTIMEIGNWVAADQSTGRIVHIPNSLIFVEPQANWTEEFEYIWNEIPITVTYESDWQLAKKILHDITNQHAAPEDEIQAAIQAKQRSKYLYFYTHVTPYVYTSIADSGVVLTSRYMCRSRERRISALRIQEAILLAYGREPKIDFAYPTRRTVMTNPPLHPENETKP